MRNSKGMKRVIAGWIRVLLLVAIPVHMAFAGPPADPNAATGEESFDDGYTPAAQYAGRQVVVKLNRGVAASDLFSDEGIVRVAGSMVHSTAVLLELTSGTDVDSAAAALNASESVEFAHPNYLINRLHPVQGSYPFSDAKLIGDYAGQQAAATLRLPEAHLVATGAGVKIGVLDVGIDFDHPLLASVATSGHDFVDGDEYSFDEAGGLHSGHGTFVAGVLHRVAPDAEITAYRIADAAGYGHGFGLALAIERAVDDGCKIINLSVVLLSRHLAVRDAIDYAASQGVLIVAAAGNQQTDVPLYPAAEEAAMAVVALDESNVRADFSTFGAHVSVSAPGTDIYSSYIDTGYAWWSGTSFSAPLVAGTAALLAQLQPQASAALLSGAIELSAIDIDDVNPANAGDLGAGLLNPIAALAYVQGPELATVLPDTIYFEHYVGRMYFVPLSEFAWVNSTNAPASFFAELVGPADSVFGWVYDSAGVTNDSIMIQINPWEVEGDYYNTLRVYVDGVAEPALATVHLKVFPPEGDFHTGWVAPGILLFQAELGTEIILSQQVMVLSSNAPAAFSGSCLPGGAQLASLAAPFGTTNDSVVILVDPARADSAGIYEDTIIFLIDSVLAPVGLLVVTEITDTPISTGPELYVDTLSAGYGTQFDICIRVGEGGQPWGGFDFALDYDPNLLTLLSVTPGNFISDCGWEHFNYTSTDSGRVQVVAVGDLSGVPGGPTCLFPDPGDVLACLRFLSVDDSAPDCNVVPIQFWWEACGDNAISTETGDAILVAKSVLSYNGSDLTGQPNRGGPDAACPSNSGVLKVTQFRNGAVFLMCDSLPGGNDVAWVIPDTISFVVDSGFTLTVLPSQWVYLFSTNAPASYVAGVSGPDSIFTLLLDSTGTTNDSTEILINPAGWPVGSYLNTVTFYVDDVAAPVSVRVLLTVQPDSTVGGEETAAALPGFIATQAPAGSSTPISSWVMLSSTNAPAVWSGFVLNFPSFASLPDSVGVTNDSVEIVMSAAGLAPGVYGDTVVFDVQGVARSAIVIVQLTVGADTIPPLSVQSYPNPFNPQTQISFALPSAAEVELHVFNILGKRVATLVERRLGAGEHRYIWDGRDLQGRPVASGVYFYRLSADDVVHTGKMVMVR